MAKHGPGMAHLPMKLKTMRQSHQMKTLSSLRKRLLNSCWELFPQKLPSVMPVSPKVGLEVPKQVELNLICLTVKNEQVFVFVTHPILKSPQITLLA